MHSLEVLGIRERCLQAEQPFQQAGCAHMLVHGSETIGALRVTYTHFMA
jgi:hypothetical protein